MKTKQAPKNVYYRRIENGRRISIGEYIRAKWNSICHPFREGDEQSIQGLAWQFKNWYHTNPERPILLVAYRGSERSTGEYLKTELAKHGVTVELE